MGESSKNLKRLFLAIHRRSTVFRALTSDENRMNMSVKSGAFKPPLFEPAPELEPYVYS
jgi:hypothetical protein